MARRLRVSGENIVERGIVIETVRGLQRYLYEELRCLVAGSEIECLAGGDIVKIPPTAGISVKTSPRGCGRDRKVRQP